jgi:hypothetical protein
MPSWNDTASKNEIADFVSSVTDPGSPDFVAAADRIAVFDNDGTLWTEQPMYAELAFAFDRTKVDPLAALAGGTHRVAEIMASSHAGMTTDEFQTIVKDWLKRTQHPRFNRPYNECIYQPMLELLDYLRSNDFKTYIVSGGGVEFIRPWAEDAYGIPPEQIIGSTGKLKYEIRAGKPVLLKLPEVDFVDDREGKPIGIQKFIGRRPIAAFGNSDGDQQMLEWTSATTGKRLAVLIHHTDTDREWAYDRKSHVGTLDKALDEAQGKGWTVVDMKTDWNRIFPN